MPASRPPPSPRNVTGRSDAPRRSPTTAQLAWVERIVGCGPRVTGGRRMPGGITSKVSPLVRPPRRPDVWTAAKADIAAEGPSGDAVFVHDDYQRFNVLWSRGRFAVLVDWSAAQIAPPDIDVGHSGLDLAVLYSAEVAERFRNAYESAAGRRMEPWWDIHQLLANDDSQQDFIQMQVVGRAPVDVPGMAGRVEQLLAMALARL